MSPSPVVCIDARAAHKALSARMIAIRQDIEAQARGVLKTYGIRLGPVTQGRHRAGLRDQLRTAAAGEPILEAVAASLIAVHEVACGEVVAIDNELRAIARDSELARRLMSVPSVGPIVALTFIATVDDVSRFAKAKQNQPLWEGPQLENTQNSPISDFFDTLSQKLPLSKS